MAITSFPARGRSLKGKYQYGRADTKTQEKRIKTARGRRAGEVKKVLIWAGLLLDATALAINALWLVKLIRSAGEEVRKRRKDGRDYTRYSSYYGYYLRSAVLGANIGALVCMLLRVCSKL